jgi:hypothetical protein
MLTKIKSGELEVRLRALRGLAKQEAFVFTLQSLIHTHFYTKDADLLYED